MNLKGILVGFCLILASNLAWAQQRMAVNGSVKDSLDRPIISATISIITRDGAGIAFGKTDKHGSFSFTVLKDTLNLKISALGYEQMTVPILQNSSAFFSIILKSKVTILNEVNLTAKQKISLTSDTLKYDVNAFRGQNDRVIGDLIERLPGINVDEKGAISYNGKPISKVYLDGDNLLDGRYRLATGSVPVTSVEEVQVIEKDQPVRALNGYSISDNVSLNLKLTENARTITMNNGHLGLGNKSYSGEFSNLILKSKIKGISGLKVNNMGENLEQENAETGASTDSEVALKSPAYLLAINSSQQPVLAEKYYLKNNDNSANINILLKLKKDWSLRFNLMTLQLKRQYNVNNGIQYFFGKDTIGYTEIQNHLHTLSQWQIQGLIERNSKGIYIKSFTRLDLPNWKKNGNTIQDAEVLAQYLPAGYMSLSNETNIIKALGPDRILQYKSLVQFYSTDESLKILPGVHADIINDSLDYLVLDQRIQTRNSYINQTATFKTKFNKMILSSSLGIFIEGNSLNSNLFKTDSTNSVTQLGNAFKNALSFNNLGLSAKAAAIYLLDKGSVSFEVSPTFNFTNYGEQGILENINRYFFLNPSFELKKAIGRYSEFNLRYSGRTRFGEMLDIYNGNILVNYREFKANRSPLPRTDINDIAIRYSYRKPLTMLFYHLNLNYELGKQNFINAIEIDKGLTRSTAIGYGNKMEKYVLNSSISKFLFFLDINFSLSTNAVLQKGYSYYNNEISPYKAKNFNISASLRKKIFQTLTISATGEMNSFINDQYLIAAHIRNSTEIRKFKASWQHNISPQLSYHLSTNITEYQQSKQKAINSYFLDFGLKYSPTKFKGTFELQGINLTNQNLYEQASINTNQLVVQQVPLRTRTFLLKYYFSF